MRDTDARIHTVPLLVIEAWSEPLIDQWTTAMFSKCSEGFNLDSSRDCLRRFFQWSHEYFLAGC
jgi:hypothetical protein